MPRRLSAPLLAAVCIAILAAAGCGGDDPQPTPTASPSPAATPAATPSPSPAASASATGSVTSAPPTPDPSVPGYPADKRTGTPIVDAAITAILAGDTAQLRSAVVYSQVLCVTNPQGAGAPPKCPAGTPNGTPVLVFQTATCEAQFLYPPDTAPTIAAAAKPGKKLYAAWQAGPAAPWSLLFAGPPEGPGRPLSATLVTVNAFGITSINFGCNADPKTRLAQLKPASYVLPPPD